MLLAHEADVTAGDVDDETPLHKVRGDATRSRTARLTRRPQAAWAGSELILAALLEKGAKVDCKVVAFCASAFSFRVSPFGRYTIGPAILGRVLRPFPYRRDPQSTHQDLVLCSSLVARRRVVANVANVASRRQAQDGSTPLHKSAYGGHLPCLFLLLEWGAKISRQDADGGTPLHNAVYNGHVGCVDYLIKKGADLNVRDARGAAVLHYGATTPARRALSPL